MRASRAIVYASLELDAQALQALSIEEMDAVLASDDAKEGTRAFLEKRRPLWAGR